MLSDYLPDYMEFEEDMMKEVINMLQDVDYSKYDFLTYHTNKDNLWEEYKYRVQKTDPIGGIFNYIEDIICGRCKHVIEKLSDDKLKLLWQDTEDYDEFIFDFEEFEESANDEIVDAGMLEPTEAQKEEFKCFRESGSLSTDIRERAISAIASELQKTLYRIAEEEQLEDDESENHSNEGTEEDE